MQLLGGRRKTFPKRYLLSGNRYAILNLASDETKGGKDVRAGDGLNEKETTVMSTGLFGRLQEELEAREKAAGLSVADILDLPDPLRRLMNWLMRQDEAGLEQVAAYIKEDEAKTQAMLDELAEKGFVRKLQISGKLNYRVRLAHRRKSQLSLDIWQALDTKTGE